MHKVKFLLSNSNQTNICQSIFNCRSQSKHSKIYETPVEEMHRYRNFIDQKHHVDAHNLHYNNGVASFKMGLNKFSDLTHDEFVGMVHGKTQDKKLAVF